MWPFLMEALWTGMSKIAKYVVNVSFQKVAKAWLRVQYFEIKQVSLLPLLGYHQEEKEIGSCFSVRYSFLPYKVQSFHVLPLLADPGIGARIQKS